jgi:hypothetical protein
VGNNNIYFVVGAYAVMWVTVIGYLLRLRSLMNRSRAALAHARTVGGTP